MAKKKTMSSQLNNLATYTSVFKQMRSLAANNFVLDIPAESIWIPYINNTLLYKSAICFFVEPALGLVALPYEPIGRIDIYGRPIKIQAYADNGYRSLILKPDEYVIMYDNTDRRSILPDIRLYAQRMALTMRTADINIGQQRTPRIVKGSKGQEQTLKKLFEQVDVNEDIIYTYKDLSMDDIEAVLMPAPYVADKLDDHASRIWNEFCRLIGIANIQEQRRERLIRSEVQAMQAGAIAGRWSRYIPRADAIKEINEKFSAYLDGEASVRYYDGEPGSPDPDGDIYEEPAEGDEEL